MNCSLFTCWHLSVVSKGLLLFIVLDNNLRGIDHHQKYSNLSQIWCKIGWYLQNWFTFASLSSWMMDKLRSWLAKTSLLPNPPPTYCWWWTEKTIIVILIITTIHSMDSIALSPSYKPNYLPTCPQNPPIFNCSDK